MVPPEMADQLRSVLPATITAVVQAVEAEVPDYRAAPDDPVQKALLSGVQVALERLLDLLGTSEAPLQDVAEVYERIGAAEYAARRPLEDVLSAYRVGATTTWHCFSRAAVQSGSSPADIAALAEAAFTYINDIAATSTAGYARAQAADAGARSRLRAQLIHALLNSETQSTTTTDLARRVRWPVPQTVAVILLEEDPNTAIVALLNELPFAIAAHTEVGPIAMLRSPLTKADRNALTSTVGQARANVGTSQPVSRAGDSLDQARTVGNRRDAWGLTATGIVWADEHLPALMVASDPQIGELLQARTLEPLLRLPPERRGPLLDTLRWWLLCQGSRQQVASTMNLHPQTISYRMDRVRALLGPNLERPESRWAIMLALRSRNPELDEQPRSAPAVPPRPAEPDPDD